MNKPYISLKAINQKGKTARKVGSNKKRRILNFIKAEKNKELMFKLSVGYGKNYKNEGVYQSKKDLIHALNAFTETDLIRDFSI